MPEFSLVPSPFFSPTQCATCSTHADPDGFVDLIVEIFPHGRIYMCSKCINQAGIKAGMYSKRQYDGLLGKLKATENQLHEAKAEVERLTEFEKLADALRKTEVLDSFRVDL